MNERQVKERLYILSAQIKNDQTHTKSGRPCKWYKQALQEITQLEKQLANIKKEP